jgi:predicted small lipoprotein YifL
MKKLVMSFAALAMMLALASCGNKSANANANAESEAADEASVEVAYDVYNVEKYNVSIDVPQGMRRTDDPVMDNGAIWSFIPEDDPTDFAIYASMSVGVYESFYGDYTDEKIQEEFNGIPDDATDKKLDLEKKEYYYAVESETINEYHRVIFKGNLEANATVSYTQKHADKIGGDIRDRILNSIKFN